MSRPCTASLFTNQCRMILEAKSMRVTTSADANVLDATQRCEPGGSCLHITDRLRWPMMVDLQHASDLLTWIVAETKKYCCLRRSSLPSYVRSSGYNTLLSVSARCLDRIAYTSVHQLIETCSSVMWLQRVVHVVACSLRHAQDSQALDQLRRSLRQADTH